MNHCFSNYPHHKYIHEHNIYEGTFGYDGTFHFNVTNKYRTFSEQYNKYGFIYIIDNIYQLFYKRNFDGNYEYCATTTLITSTLCTIYDKQFIFNTAAPIIDGQEIIINKNRGIFFCNLY